MVQEANIKRAQAEKSFAESEMKVGNLTIESNLRKMCSSFNKQFELSKFMNIKLDAFL